jgi:hypothetical protein
MGKNSSHAAAPLGSFTLLNFKTSPPFPPLILLPIPESVPSMERSKREGDLSTMVHIQVSIDGQDRLCAGIFKQSMGTRNRVGVGLSYRPARLKRLAKLIPWNRYLDFLKVEKLGSGFVAHAQ